MLERGWSVYAGTVDQPAKVPSLTAKEADAVRWIMLDVRSDEDVDRAVQQATPDYVVHLAGIAFAPEANATPMRAFDINALGAMRLLQRLHQSGAHHARTLVIGSAEQYGAQPPEAYPIAEEAPLRPLTPYAVAKAAQEMIALQAFRAQGQDVVCTRSFNHSGVGHGASYLLPTLVRRVRELGRSGGALTIGNGHVIRDYLHVQDVIAAYLLLLERGQAGEVYNVCSGAGTTVESLARKVLERAGVTAEVRVEDSLRRPIDVPILVGNNAKLRGATGWSVTRSIDDIIDDLLHAAAN